MLGGFISPVHVAYGKPSLVSNFHRVNMVGGSLEDSSWISVDPWECQQAGYSTTEVVLHEHFTAKLRGVQVAGASAPPRVLLVCGGDLLESFPSVGRDGRPLWSLHDQEALLSCGLACIQREGTNLEALIAGNPLMRQYRPNIYLLEATVQNNMSSSLVRKVLKDGDVADLKYLCHDFVVDYIRRHRLQDAPNWR